MVILRSEVGVNYREPPDKIGRVGISGAVNLEFEGERNAGFVSILLVTLKVKINFGNAPSRKK